MTAEAVQRRLAAILAADVAGYSRLVGRDEEGTLARLKALRREIIDPRISSHRGRIVKTTGDGLLAEFGSVVDAVRCAVAVQRACVESETALPQYGRIEFRIGINLGDIVVEGDDILGDGVNIAARLEGIAEPGGICISGVVHDQVRGKVEVEFADLGRQSLKNITQPVQAYRVLFDGNETATSSPPLPLPDKPSIAVLPFQNMSGDPEQGYFADGMVEEIITALSRIRWLFVIARNSTFTYKGQTVDVKRVGRELGVRYVLEGSVRKGDRLVRITAQLIEADTGAHLWADRFDGSLEDVFDLQDKVASSVAGVIEPALKAAEAARSARRPTADMGAYDLYLRAWALLMSSTGQAAKALQLVEQALALDPEYGAALGLAAVCCQRVFSMGGDEEAHRQKATDFARRALRVGSDDPRVLSPAAFVLALFGEDVGAMITFVDRALALNPNDAGSWHTSGMLRCWAGQLDVAIEHLETSLRLDPRAPPGFALRQIGQAYFFSRRFADAVPKLLSAIQVDPHHPLPYRLLAACYAHMGRIDEARNIIERLRVVTPVVMPRAIPFVNPDHRKLYLSGLRLAMCETT